MFNQEILTDRQFTSPDKQIYDSDMDCPYFPQPYPNQYQTFNNEESVEQVPCFGITKKSCEEAFPMTQRTVDISIRNGNYDNSEYVYQGDMPLCSIMVTEQNEDDMPKEIETIMTERKKQTPNDSLSSRMNDLLESTPQPKEPAFIKQSLTPIST